MYLKSIICLNISSNLIIIFSEYYLKINKNLNICNTFCLTTYFIID